MILELLAPMVNPVKLAKLAHLAPRAFRGLQGNRACREELVLLGRRGLGVSRAQLGLQVSLVQMASLVILELWVNLGRQV